MTVTVLIVDDDAAVRLVTSEMLSRLDCEITCAEGGQEALDILEDHSFDVVLLDVGMPVMSGVEAYGRMRECSPDQDIVFMTGYSKEEITGLDNAHTWILPKPFSLQQLSAILADVNQA